MEKCDKPKRKMFYVSPKRERGAFFVVAIILASNQRSNHSNESPRTSISGYLFLSFSHSLRFDYFPNQRIWIMSNPKRGLNIIPNGYPTIGPMVHSTAWHKPNRTIYCSNVHYYICIRNGKKTSAKKKKKEMRKKPQNKYDRMEDSPLSGMCSCNNSLASLYNVWSLELKSATCIIMNR